MILYLTKETIETYKVKMPYEMRRFHKKLANSLIEKEKGNRILEWGGKIFYFDKRKCLQVINFESKFTLFFFDFKEIEDVGEYISHYLFEIYKNNIEMKKLLEKYFVESPILCLSSLKDKSIIATLNYTQRAFADNGDRFYDFIQNGILKTIEINKKINFEYLFSKKVENKTEYFYSNEMFEETLKKRYKSKD
ncbi:DUF6933 domain-containing protein [Fusobacterium nucleatum]|uniref:DUF6933 domain-containing protein n=1 Tax=Fusobacterium nucleatum TaxID=851 RepID=UPI00040816F5|nr:hypothetical protein [Fusobacterium nucleatum]